MTVSYAIEAARPHHGMLVEHEAPAFAKNLHGHLIWVHVVRAAKCRHASGACCAVLVEHAHDL